jgi:hypothetical protein
MLKGYYCRNLYSPIGFELQTGIEKWKTFHMESSFPSQIEEGAELLSQLEQPPSN